MPPGIDCIGALPEGILHHILSFLPAQEAVRTCVLAQRWRHLWKCTTGLRIVGNKGPVSVQLLRKFMDHLLILRERTDLDTVGIEFRKFREDDVPFVNLWIRFALQSKVRALTVCHYDDCNQPFNLDGLPFVSPCLRTLVLSALEDLTIGFSVINVGKISSLSLKCLSIFRCRSYLDDRVRVSAPCLVSLKLLGFSGVTPLLESMPLLETAFLTLGAHGHLTSQDIC
uniref:F-box domain-containing protein n=1 Tax=Triticum aestivum TaxID=4565 RepID=A0A3B6JG77_WHEAT